jgi:rhodanese-related sulfurtransferase
MQQISTHQLSNWIAESRSPGDSNTQQRPKPLLLDVREPWEYEHCHLAGSLLMPMNAVPARLNELDADADVVVICHHGGRSMQVAMFLERSGFSSIYNLAGGVNAWAHDIDPAMRKY